MLILLGSILLYVIIERLYRYGRCTTEDAISGARRAAAADGTCVSGIAGSSGTGITRYYMYLHCIETV